MFLPLKVFFIFLIILALGPVQYFLIKTKLRQRIYIPIIFHKALLKILGVKVTLIGKKTSFRPLILSGNHTSYIDIIILGSIMPICFILKRNKIMVFIWFFGKNAEYNFYKKKNFKTLENIKNINKDLD